MKATYWKGHLNPQDPRVKHYCEHTLAPRLTDWESIAKMLYWQDHAQEPIRDPIILGVDKQGINGCHPGTTRFLSCHLLGKSAPVRLTAQADLEDLQIITRARQMRRAPNERAQDPRRRADHRAYGAQVMEEYGARARELIILHGVTHHNAYGFYVDLYKKTS